MKLTCFRACAAIALLLSISHSTFAASAHTWVASTGSDSNSGTRLSPYATLQKAIDNTTAGGTVSIVDVGDYGKINIAHAVTIDGGGPRCSIALPTGDGVTVTAGTTDQVVLHNLDIDGNGTGSNGITVNSGVVTVDNCSIRGFTTYGIFFASTALETVDMKDTTIVGGSVGVRSSNAAAGPDKLSMRDCTINQASDCGMLMRVGLADVTDCTIANCANGIETDTSASVSLTGCTISGNGTGILAFTGTTIRLSKCSLLDNTTGVNRAGGTLLTLHNNINITSGAAGSKPSANSATF